MVTSVNYTQKNYRDVFEKYFNDLLQNRKTKLIETGPYISISRDFGCMANVIAQKLSKELTKRNKASGIRRDWKWVNKIFTTVIITLYLFSCSKYISKVE